MTNRWSKVLKSLIIASGRFPLVVLAGVVGLGTALVLSHTAFDAAVTDRFVRVVQTVIAALPLGVAAGLAGEARRRLRWLTIVAALALSVGVWMALPPEMETFAHAYRYAAILLGVAALASAVPGVDGNSAWWRINVAMIQAILLAGTLSGFVALGLQLAVFSVEKLFGFNLGKLHIDLMSFAVFIIAPLAVITLLPTDRERSDTVASAICSSFWEGFCKWALAPLGFIFTAILSAYIVVILIHWKLPDGIVAMPVLSLGAYGTATMLLLQPWQNEKAWARWFARIYPSAFLVSSILMFMAIAERISAYGVTFARYSALAFGLWFALAALAFLFRTDKSALLITTLLAVMAALAALGPTSAATLSLRSQTERLRQLLQNPASEVEEKQVLSGVSYLATNFGLAAVEDVTGPLGLGSESVESWRIPAEAMKKLGLKTGGGNFKFKWNEIEPIPTEGFRFIHESPRMRFMVCRLGKSTAGKPLTVEMRSGELALFAGDEKLRELLPSALVHIKSDTESALPIRVPFAVDGREFRLVVLSANVETEDDGRRRLENVKYLILEK
jgi:hypothetical protein